MEDTTGNKLYRQQDAIYLKLKSEGFRRKVADIHDNTLIMKRSSKKHLHIKMNGYGFNYLLLSTAEKVEHICLIIDNKKEYHFPISTVLDKGEFLYFKQQGFEKQIFLNINTIKEYELGRGVQKV
jgi:hypothetical protein